MSSQLRDRQWVINLIDAAGKRDEFTTGWAQSPEDYFDMYHYLEPEVWQNVLNDLGIAVDIRKLAGIK